MPKVAPAMRFDAGERARRLSATPARPPTASAPRAWSSSRTFVDGRLAQDAERLRDVQRLHAHMVSELERVAPGRTTAPKPAGEGRRSRSGEQPEIASTGEVLDVPEFIPGG